MCYFHSNKIICLLGEKAAFIIYGKLCFTHIYTAPKSQAKQLNQYIKENLQKSLN